MMELSYRRHRLPPVVIQHAVWLYLRGSANTIFQFRPRPFNGASIYLLARKSNAEFEAVE